MGYVEFFEGGEGGEAGYGGEAVGLDGEDFQAGEVRYVLYVFSRGQLPVEDGPEEKLCREARPLIR